MDSLLLVYKQDEEHLHRGDCRIKEPRERFGDLDALRLVVFG